MNSSQKKMGRVRTKTYSITLYLVLLAVAIQFGVIIWNFSIRSQVKIDIEAPEIPVQEAVATSIPDPKPVFVQSKPSKPLPLGENSPPSVSPPPSVNERIQTLLLESQRFLDQGDPSLARNALLQAESLAPENIEVLKKLIELAEKIQNKELAADYHKKLLLITGITSDGLTPHPESLPIQPIAPKELPLTQKLEKNSLSENESTPSATPPDVTPPSTQLLPRLDPSTKKILIGTLEKKIIPSSTAKTEFLLKIPIIASQSTEPIEPGKISIKLYFYEIQSDGKILPSNARLDVSFENRRPTWSNRSEILNALYSLPASQSNRSYYGYRMKVYYKGQFQNEISEPENLNEKFP